MSAFSLVIKLGMEWSQQIFYSFIHFFLIDPNSFTNLIKRKILIRMEQKDIVFKKMMMTSNNNKISLWEVEVVHPTGQTHNKD